MDSPPAFARAAMLLHARWLREPLAKSSRPFALCLAGQLDRRALTEAAPLMVATALASGGILTVLEPANAAALPYATRFAFWVAHAVAALIAYLGARSALDALAAARLDRRLVAVGALIVASLLLAPVSMWLDSAFGALDLEPEIAGGLAAQWLDEAVSLLPNMTIFWAGLALVLPRTADRHAPPESAPAPPRVNDLVRRLPAALGDDIVSISSEDHYVRIRTSRGECLLLGALRDAISGFEPDEGVQIHRSHWVRRAHVAGLSAGEGGWECILAGGGRLPVGRRRLAAVRGALSGAERRERSRAG